MSKIIDFYKGIAPDNLGRYLTHYRSMDYESLEGCHDHIQWFFPLPVSSKYNIDAPILTSEDIYEFRSNEQLQLNLLESFTIFLDFLGLEIASQIEYPPTLVNGKPKTHEIITKAPHFESRAKEWITPYNHNLLRITRILGCLTLLGLTSYALMFYDFLEKNILPDNRKTVGHSAIFWVYAVNGILF
jgi:hypothetical protein